MRVLSCIVTEHDLRFVLLAAIMCLVGSVVTMSLFRRALFTKGLARHGWTFLAAVCGGSSIWATHFIAVLGYHPHAPVTFDPVLTLVSVLIAIVGSGVGFAVSSGFRFPATIIGGAIVGLAISSMHYVGMFAYRVEGAVSWSLPYAVASVLLSVIFGAAALYAACRWIAGPRFHVSTALLTISIVSLHFTGMAAFQVTPLLSLEAGANDTAFTAMALSILIVGLIVVGTGISSYLIDDRTRASSDEQLRHMAFHDPLTGLGNRRSLQARLDHSFELDEPATLLLIDLDHFKHVNDTFGHAVGDTLLVEVAQRISVAIEAGDFAARIGGDELAVLVRGLGSKGKAIADAIVRDVGAPFSVGGHVLVVGCSIGLCDTAHADKRDALMQQADIALYEAKRLGRNRSFAYEHGMLEEVAARHQLEADMKVALRNGQFHLVYQPIVDLSDGHTIGFEALLRWRHPVRGMVSPAEFIPLSEENGSIVAIGGWVLEQACREAAQWRGDLFVAVNVSAVQFRSPILLAQVTHALSISGLPATRLEIEVTETAIVESGEHVAHTLQGLRTLGIKISMDDFGTGYSSLVHLRDLPLDRIKIDRSFVSTATSDQNSMAVLRAITQLGRDIGIPTVGEGVETAEQMAMLQGVGCKAAQGYLIGRPGACVGSAQLEAAACA